MTRNLVHIWKLGCTVVWIFQTTIIAAQFGPAKLIDPILDNPVEALVVDLNLDGLDDILVIAENETGFFLNLGSEYSERILITKDYSSPTDCEVADLDGDGFVDIIVCYEDQSEIVWFENDGDGLFGPAQNIVAGVNAWSVVAGNIDNDQDVDLVYYDVSTNEVILLSNAGDGSFEDPILVVHDQANSIVLGLADMNSDGALDIVGPCSASLDLGIHWGQGDGTFEEEILPLGINGRELLVIEDLNEDQQLDIVIAATNGVLGFIQNLGGEAFSVYTQLDVVPSPNSLLVGDATGDGLPDVLCTSENDFDVRLFENSDGGFLVEQLLNPDQPIVDRCLGFVQGENDGLLIDHATGISIIQDLTLLDFENPQMLTQNAGLNSELHIADLDGDGYEDIVGFSETHLWVMYGDSVARFGEKQMIEEVALPHIGVTSLDVDENGLEDIVFVGGNDFEIKVKFQTDNNAWSETEQLLVNVGIESIWSGDVNGNGLNDLIVTGLEEFIFYENLGAGQYDGQLVVLDQYLWSGARLADVDADGDLDAVLFGSDNIQILEFEENYNSSSELITSTIFPLDLVQICDLSADGIADILLGSSVNGSIYTVIGLGGLEFTNGLFNTVVLGLSDLVASDFNSDGLSDFVTISNSGVLSFFQNQGSQEFQNEILEDQLLGDSRVVLGDFDHDGDEDLAHICYQFGSVFAIENLFHSVSRFQGYCYVDFDGDGVEDPGDVPFPFVKMRLAGLDSYFYSDLGGNFTTYSDTGTFEISPEYDGSLFTISTDQLSYSATLTQEEPVSSGNDFGFFPIGWQEKINGEFVTGAPRCDDIVEHRLSVCNSGNSIPSGVVEYELDELCSFVSSDPAPDSTNGNSIYFSYQDLFFFSEANFEVEVQMPAADVPMPWLTHYLTVHAEGEFDDLNVVNVDSLSEQLLCSYDPNDKLEEIGYTPEGFITPDDTLEYTVRFQNTGNDTAFSVMIRDQLPYFVDRSTIHPIQWSHPFELYIENDGEAVFTFENINLLDSLTNEPESKGFIKFEAQPVDGISDGSKIYNAADIYFDQNIPITTNTFVNEIYDCDVGIEIVLNQAAFCLGDTLIAAHGYKGLSTIDWQFQELIGSDSIFCTIVTVPGEYNLVLNSDDPLCGSRHDSILIMIGELIQPGLLTDPEPICEGDSLMLVSDYLEGNAWYLSNEQVGAEPYLMVDEEGVYELQIENSGCLSPFLSVQVDVNPIPEAVIIAQDTSICEGHITHLLANAAENYQWLANGQIIGEEQILEVSEPALISLLVQNEDCTSTPDSLEIYGLPTPIAFASGDMSFCEGDTTLLASLSADSSLWLSGEDLLWTGSEFEVFESGEYSLLILGEWCESLPFEFSVLEVDKPTAFIYQDEVAFCPESAVIIEAGPFDFFEWYAGIDLIGEDDEQEIDEEGEYTLLVKEDGCWSEPYPFEAFEFEGAPIPSILESGNGLICNIIGTGINHDWWHNDSPIVGADAPIYYPEQSGTYSVEIEDENGCMAMSDPVEFIHTHVSDQEDSGFNLYPNPTSDYIYLSWAQEFTGEIVLRNALGQLIQEEPVNAIKHLRLDLSAISHGTYVLIVTGDSFMERYQLIKR